MSILILALFAHWFGDFVLQSDWMAINKSRSWSALAAHAAVVSAPLALVFALAASGRYASSWDVIMSAALVGAAVNGAAHFAIDAVTSRINARLWAAEQRHWFFVCIGFDQWLHVSLIIATLAVLEARS